MTICLVGGLIGGGLFADFSDIETSRDNFFKTGSLDLKVSDFNGNEFQDPDVPAFFNIRDAWPCCDKSVFFDLENWGQGWQCDPFVYIHIKNVECGWIYPKNVFGWVDCDCNFVDPPLPPPPATEWAPGMQGTGLPKPVTEPEYVAECGGVAGEDRNGLPVEVPGIGCCYGENCELPRHITVFLWMAGPWAHEDKPETSADVPSAAWVAVDLSKYDTDPADGVIKLNELICQQIELGTLPNCNGIWLHMALHLQDIDEDDLIAQGVLVDPGTGYGWFDETNPIEAKWDHWPSNALQKDGIHFDMAFELLQTQAPDP